MTSRPEITEYFNTAGRWLRRLWGHFPLSGPGAILLATIAAGTYYFGVKQSDYVLLLTGGALIGAALVDILIVIMSAAALSFSFHSHGEKPSVLDHLRVSLPSISWLLILAGGIYYYNAEKDNKLLEYIAGFVLMVSLVTLLGIIAKALFQSSAGAKPGTANSRLQLATNVEGPSGRTLPRFLPPLIEASTHILNPPDFDCSWKRSQDKKREEWLVSGRRCMLEENFRLVRRVIVKDVLGFASVDWEQEEPMSLVVLPGPLPVKAQSILRARFTGDDIPDPRGEAKGDRVDMRRYTPGDPPRMLLWKVYARTGKLMVRVPEAAITTAPRTCAYLVAGPGDETLASLARTVVEGNLLGQGWRFGADGSSKSVENKEQALQLIARSGNPGVEYGAGISAFLAQAYGEGFGSCLLFIPPDDGEWVERVASAISRSPISISLLTVGSVAQKEEEPKWKKWVFYEESNKTDPSELLSRLNSSMVTDWLTFESETSRLIPLKARSQAASKS